MCFWFPGKNVHSELSTDHRAACCRNCLIDAAFFVLLMYKLSADSNICQYLQYSMYQPRAPTRSSANSHAHDGVDDRGCNMCCIERYCYCMRRMYNISQLPTACAYGNGSYFLYTSATPVSRPAAQDCIEALLFCHVLQIVPSA